MSVLKNYKSFSGRHWETGSIHNALAHQGFIAPHTGKPYSEEFLLGMSGGINFGYFTFQYTGLPPQLAILTRNTFDPFQTLLERMGVPQEVYQTGSASKGLDNLLSVLEEGKPAIVWADAFSMPYEALSGRVDYWAMQPIVVYGHDGKRALVADRSGLGLEVSAKRLEAARARIKKDKFRVISLGEPSEAKLVSSVNLAIWQCVRAFTEAPPRGTRSNFGLAAYEHWSRMLTNTRNKQSWERFFPAKEGHFSAIAGNGPFPGLLDAIFAWGDMGAERERFAVFLEEAAIMLKNQALVEVAEEFRKCHALWINLADVLGANKMPSLMKAKKLIFQRGSLFIQKGADAMQPIKAINNELSQLSREWPKNEGGNEMLIAGHRKSVQSAVNAIKDAEGLAIQKLSKAMSQLGN